MKKEYSNIHIIEILVIISLIVFLGACQSEVNQEYFSKKRSVKASHFVGSHTCKECHEDEFAAWMGSHHQLAMQEANDSTMLADFNDSHFESRGVQYRFFREGEKFMVNTIAEDGEYKDFEIKYTFGVIPLQQYIIEFEKGNHQCLLAAWDSDSLRWFDLQPNLDIHHEEWMHWTGGSMTWNNMCADCHSTFVQKNYDRTNKTYNTSFTEISVGCESCHGPGDLHNEYYYKEEKHAGLTPPVMYMPKTMESTEIVQKCARCHSRRSMLTPVFDYEGHFLDHYFPELLHYPTYEQDGQILDEDYVYGSFMQSRMYHEGISCRDCHDMHSLELRLQGNTLCLLCHEPKYNSFEHHYHKMDTEASQCINCHMTGRYYMGNDFRRDHSFRNPRPDQSLKYGTPNACNACHTDKDAAWAAEFVKEKYGPKRPDHFSDKLLVGLQGETDSLIALLQIDTFPEIIRATAIQAFSMQIDEQDELAVLIKLLKDSSAMVRREAILAVNDLGLELDQEIEVFLDDSIRAVRIAAARYFVLNAKKADHESFEKARSELMTDLEVNSDFASGNHQWALYHQARDQELEAISSYKEALRIDNFYNMGRMNLALLEYDQGNAEAAEKLYLKVIQQEPQYSYPWFMLGLMYNEIGDPGKSLAYLKGACEREPFLPRAHYNYALKLHEIRKYSEAQIILDKVLSNDPQNESFLYVKLLGLMELGKNRDALGTIDKLLDLAPQNPDYQAIRRELSKK